MENTANDSAEQVRAISHKFSTLIRGKLSSHLAEIVRRNRTPAYARGCCATHDFSDSNMIMAEAFEIVMGRESDCASLGDADILNRAWDKSKADEFNAID